MDNLYNSYIEVAEMSRSVMDEFDLENPDNLFRRYFHLRPAADAVHIVCTHDERIMKTIKIGGKTNDKRRASLIKAVTLVSDCISADYSVDWGVIAQNYNCNKGFAEGGKIKPESVSKALMINEMGNNPKLKELLRVETLYFTASDLGFEKGDKTVDIVAHDGAGKVFLFEVKAPGKKANNIDLPQSFMGLYAKSGERNGAFEEAMRNFPQNPINAFDEYAAYGIIGYGGSPEIVSDMLISCG